MIIFADFQRAVSENLERDITPPSNPEQNDAVGAPLAESLFLVAGPGSGKTTVIVLRVLKLIFVDDVDPTAILVTTFTKRAAGELRSRILGWGDMLRSAFLEAGADDSLDQRLKDLDFNRVITGTIDSIAEQTLTDNRLPGSPPPIVIENFVANALMIGRLWPHGRFRDRDLRAFVARVRGSSWNLNLSEISGILRDIKDRFFHDQIDVHNFRSTSSDRGVEIACEAIDEYVTELGTNLFYDFARLEAEFLRKLSDGELGRFLETLRFVLVDEYQDTNLLQELTYSELAAAAIRNGGSVTVVGDDDQSLYRFRGATVEIFQAFSSRFTAVLGSPPRTIYLSRNYRSAAAVVNAVNEFVQLDPVYQSGRVGGKPEIVVSRTTPHEDYPVFGMFRDSVTELAHDLTEFIHAIVHSAYSFSSDESRYEIRINQPRGSPADLALLMSSPRELDSQGRPRLPLLLRQGLQSMSPSINVFNPRGQSLETIPEIERLCGLLLECIDPGAAVQGSTNLPTAATNTFNIWRHEAQDYIGHNPQPRAPNDLGSFVTSWQTRSPLGRSLRNRREVLLTDLIYKLVTWVPEMQDDIEGLVYLEAITRTVTQTSLFTSFGGEIIFDPRNPGSRLEQGSVREALWNILTPLATGAIEINEDLLETLPTDRLNIMSIHQAKGLEFPLVIVDVGSDFRTEHHSQAFKRFPARGGVPHMQEDLLRSFSPLGAPTRSGQERAFDDLVRQSFVAYSRAQDVLVLVGLNSVKDGVKNIATGWDRSGIWHWGPGLPNLVHIP